MHLLILNHYKVLVFIISTLIFGCGIFEVESEVNQGIYFFPTGLDPALNTDFLEYQIFSQIYEPLIKLDNDYHTLKPCLAESWRIAENNLSYTFQLKSDIRFHDKTLLRAEDVKFSFERQIKMRVDYPLFEIIDKIIVIDSLKIRIDLKVPYTPFLYSLASPNGLVVISKDALLKYGDEIKWHPMGTGPYILESWSENRYLVLKAFDDYRWEIGLKRIKFMLPDSSTDSDLLFSSGELDVLYMVSGYWLDRLKWLGRVKYFVQKPLNTLYLGFNVKNKPVDNINFRKAILSAIENRKSVFLTNRGNAIPAHGPLPPVYEGFSDLKQGVYDPLLTNMLLRNSGVSMPVNLNLYLLSYRMGRKTIVELLKNELEKIGIKLTFTYFDDAKLFYQAIKNNECHLFLDGYGSELIGDPGNFLYTLFHSRSKNNRMNYINEYVDVLIDDAFREANDQKRHELYRQVVRIVLEDTPAVFRAHVKSNFAYNSQKIKSIAVSPYEFVYYHQLKLIN